MVTDSKQWPKSKHANSKERLLQLTPRLIKEAGISISVRDIARYCEVNIAAIHYHFGNKDGLFQCIFQALVLCDFEEGKRHLKEASTVEEVRENIKKFLLTLVKIYQKNDVLFQAYIQAFDTKTISLPHKNSGIFGSLYDALQNYLKECSDKKIIAEEKLSALQLVTLAPLVSLIRNDMVNNSFYDVSIQNESEVNTIIDLIVSHIS